WTPRLAWRRYGSRGRRCVYRNAKSSRQTARAIATVSIAARTISLLVFTLLSPSPVQDREDVYEGEIPEAHTEADRYHLEQRANDQVLWHARYSRSTCCR